MLHSNVPQGHDDYFKSSMVTREEREELLEDFDEEEYMQKRFGVKCISCQQ